jgi:glutamine synthetase
MNALQDSLKAQGVHTLIAQFTDLHGVARGKFVPLNQLDLLLSDGVGFAGPSIWGTGLPRTGPRSEYYGRGDIHSAAHSARALPWMPGYARVVCDGYVAGEPFDACPRQVLKRQTARLAERGWVLRTGIEPEFFLLRKTAEGYEPFDASDLLLKPSYDLKSLPRQREFLKQLADGLTGCGLDVFQIDHEDAHGQYELNFHHADALTSADNLMLFKMAAHELAEQHGMVFSMMPKPFANQPGSGMHFHVSMWDGDGPDAQCVFDDDRSDLSALAHHFIAGVLHHSAALCALAAPTVNSYKRLTVGESISGTTWAPAYVAHGPNNRTALVRTLRGRFEWRVPDASANPYLATAALIAAGLDGIDRQLKLGPACVEDLFKLSLTDIRLRGIEVLPQSLSEAIDALQANEVIADALGDTLCDQFCQLKRDEWTEYARHVSGWELARYGAMF